MWEFSDLDFTFTSDKQAMYTLMSIHLKRSFFFSVLGFHPHQVGVYTPQKIELLETVLQSVHLNMAVWHCSMEKTKIHENIVALYDFI